uniref:Uncharacterized protein n=1 Tax=Parasteatoda tepidariorum TaxID=114398 RepID=A0A2L2Z1R9_PARTP
MDSKWVTVVLLIVVASLSRQVTGMNHYYQQYEDSYPRRRPYDEDRILYTFSSNNPHYPQNHPIWEQFWDAYNYKGPLEEDPRYLENNFGINNDYSRPGYFVPSRPVSVVPARGVDSNRNEAYNRYREYFFRRYGSNYID